MGDDALIKNVFGSDSDSDDDAAAAAPPAAAPTEDAGAAKGDDAEGEVHADADLIPDADDAERDGADPDRPPGFKSSLEENLSDEEPPYVTDVSANTSGIYDFLGRVFYARVKMSIE